jgi:hypothetical protein
MEKLYWICQGIFAVALVTLATSGGFSEASLIGAAAIQLGLVGWRLWLARTWLWLVLIPPASTVAIWNGLGLWARKEEGGDGAGLLAVMMSLAWCVLAYVGVALWAGARQAR